ncbi:hypothetical protein KDW_32470 [Dictyobacter vulcani]|uniref:Uncharacterized protein n=1 Tax=Dictyobacter vulcani TaxID=2607529 RepID=A0A5J4KMH3_9CHLR|nr:hypothetical protein KDW_32470 [Dictyobacter vulcani]
MQVASARAVVDLLVDTNSKVAKRALVKIIVAQEIKLIRFTLFIPALSLISITFLMDEYSLNYLDTFIYLFFSIIHIYHPYLLYTIMSG